MERHYPSAHDPSVAELPRHLPQKTGEEVPR